MSSKHWLDYLSGIFSISGDIIQAGGQAKILASKNQLKASIFYKYVFDGRSYLEDPHTRVRVDLCEGDIVAVFYANDTINNWMLGEKTDGIGIDKHAEHCCCSTVEEGDVLTGRFYIDKPHLFFIKRYFPELTIIRSQYSPLQADKMSATCFFRRLCTLIKIESRHKTDGSSAILATLHSALFALIMRAAIQSCEHTHGLLSIGANSRLNPAITAIFANPANDWGVTELAEKCGMEETAFVDLFESKLDATIPNILHDVKLASAITALKDLSLTVEAIAGLSGFASIGLFRTVFYSKLGITPNDWRNKIQGY